MLLYVSTVFKFNAHPSTSTFFVLIAYRTEKDYTYYLNVQTVEEAALLADATMKSRKYTVSDAFDFLQQRKEKKKSDHCFDSLQIVLHGLIM